MCIQMGNCYTNNLLVDWFNVALSVQTCITFVGLEEILYFAINHFMTTCHYPLFVTNIATIYHPCQFCNYLVAMLQLHCDY
jgi:hypothetical protein